MHCISSRNNLHSDFNTRDCWRTQGAFVVMSLRSAWREALLGSGMRSSGAAHPAFFPFVPWLLRSTLPVTLLSSHSFFIFLLFFSSPSLLPGYSFLPISITFFLPFSSKKTSSQIFFFSEYIVEGRTGCNRI